MLERLEEEKGRSTVEYNDLCDQLREERDNVSATYKVVAGLRADNEDLRSRLARATSQNHTLEARVTTEARVKDQQIESTNQMLHELRAEMEKISSSRAAEAARTTEGRRALQRAEERAAALEATSGALETAVAQHRARAEEGATRLRGAERALQEKEREVLAVKSSLAESARAGSIRDGSVAMLRSKVESAEVLEGQVREAQQRAQRLEVEVSGLREQNGLMNKELRLARTWTPAPPASRN